MSIMVFVVGGKGLTQQLWVIQIRHIPRKGHFGDWPLIGSWELSSWSILTDECFAGLGS